MRLKNMSLRFAVFCLAGIFFCIPFRSVCHARMMSFRGYGAQPYPGSHVGSYVNYSAQRRIRSSYRQEDMPVNYRYYDAVFGSFITDEDSVAEMKEKVMIMRTMLEENSAFINKVLSRIPQSMRHNKESDAYWSIYIHYERYHYKLMGKTYRNDEDLKLMKDLFFIMDVYTKKYEIRRIENKIKRHELWDSFLAFIKIKPLAEVKA